MERTPRRFWTFAISAGAMLVILAAAASGVFRLAVQSVPGYRADVERYVRELTGQNVRIADLALTWQYYYPSLDLNGIALLAADGKTAVLQAERLRLGFALTRLLRGDTAPNRLELQGMGLNATIGRDGELSVQGIESPGGEPGEALEGLRALTRFSRVRLERCRLNLRDERRGREVWSFGIERASLDRGLLGDVVAMDLALPAPLGDSAHLESSFTGDLLQPSTWSGTVSGMMNGLVAQTWLAPGLVRGANVTAADAEVRFQGRIDQGSPTSMRLELHTGAVRARRAQHVAALEALEVQGEVEVLADGWHARVERIALDRDGTQWSTAAELKATRGEDGPAVYDGRVESLRIADLAPWLQIARVPPALAALSRTGGTLRDLQLRFQEGGELRYGYRVRFEDLALAASGSPAGFSGLRGEVAGDELGGRAVLQESAVTLELPGKLVTPSVPLEAFEAELEWRSHNGGWVVGMPQFRWQVWGLRGRGRLELTLPEDGGAPVLDLAAQFTGQDVTRAKPLIPQVWGAGLRSWLDRSIVAGRATRGELVIQGPLADFPFHVRKTGRWSLDIDAADVELSYHPDWPGVNDVAAHLHFEGNSLDIETRRGSVLGNPIEAATARFADFATGQLLIDGRVRGETARFYDFVSKSPLRETLKGLVTQTTAAGPSAVTVHLEIPVKDATHTQVSGEVDVGGVELRHYGLPEPIKDVRGLIRFANRGISADRLAARLYDAPVQASIAPQADGTSLLSAALDATVDPSGKGASELIPEWLHKRASGASSWRASLPLGGALNAPLRLTSDLVGVEVDYPAPLGKEKDESRPLVVTVGSEGDAPLRVTVEVGDQLGADLRFARRRNVLTLGRGVLRLGAGGVPVATEPGLLLTGELKEVDVAQWYDALESAGIGAAGQVIRRADLRLGLARWSPFALREVRYQWTATPGGWSLALSGGGGQGELQWTSTDRGLLTARLERLAVGYAPAEATAEAGAQAQSTGPAIDPNALPLFDADVRHLKVGQADLGHVSFATVRTESGQKTRALKADGGMVTLSGEGEWRRRSGQSSATLNGDLSTGSISTLLKAFGFTPNLDAKSARFKYALAWAPSSDGLDWALGEGTVHLDFENGQLRAVEPGAGRVLGLVNFYALPRRLTLNFRDVVSSGLGFDKITGDFELRDGSAHTQNLKVDGPSVRMDMKGRIGLAARDYDQEVTVYPDVSGGVTLGAALIGGPIAGVLALIAQEVLNRPLNQVTQLSYRVTGSWDNPQVARVGAPPEPEKKTPAKPRK
ncbi:MAG: YhdP family protein [Gammaproteobacteria bacterium]